jgi:hypothetical protein
MTIQEILTDLHVEFREAGSHHHARPGWIQIRQCPFCSSDNFHLGYNLQAKYFNCWKCGGHFGPKVLEALGLAREKARALYQGIDTTGLAQSRERARVSVQEPSGRRLLGPIHELYLLRRGFDPKQIVRLWGVEAIGVAARLAWRLYIPIFRRGVKVSWTTRAIGEKIAQRYISASAEEEAVNHKEVVYGLDFCGHSVVICEGPLDAWKVGPGAGALFGTTFSTAQVKELVSIPRRFICFDSSPEAQRKAHELANQLSSFPGVTENLLIDAKDPGDASPKEIKLIRKVARL